jgi:hypothetical protein
MPALLIHDNRKIRDNLLRRNPNLRIEPLTNLIDNLLDRLLLPLGEHQPLHFPPLNAIEDHSAAGIGHRANSLLEVECDIVVEVDVLEALVGAGGAGGRQGVVRGEAGGAAQSGLAFGLLGRGWLACCWACWDCWACLACLACWAGF